MQRIHQHMLTGFALASIILCVMLPVSESGALLGQSADESKENTGYFFQSGFDILPPAGSQSYPSARLFVVNGHRFTPSLSVGVGLGYTPYNDPLSLIPFFFDVSYRFIDEGFSPVLFLRTGYNFSVDYDEAQFIDEHSGGLLLHPGAGFEVPFSDMFLLYLNAGYNIDNSSYKFESWGDRDVETDLSFRRLSIGFGFKITP
jgi:hypothetical protein